MKIATYNILLGGKIRVHWVKMIEGQAVDLLLVQESFDYHEHLQALQYPDARSQSVWEKVEKSRWGSAVFSRNGSVKPIRVKGFPGWVVGAKISGAAWQTGIADPLLVFSLHIPHGAGGYSGQVIKVLDEIKQVSRDQALVLGGDFNITVSKGCGSKRRMTKKESAIQTRLSEEFGLLNTWEAANRDLPPHQTLRWSGDRTIPYHCDGIFVPKSWKDRLKSCVVLSGEEWNSLSDHNPVVAHIQ